MATKTFKVALSLDNPRLIQTGIGVQSFDRNSVKISISLTKDSQAYKIPTGASIKISLFKVNRQEQKIIADVPNNSVDSIEWVVPDYLDGYSGTVRVGVYLINGDESVDLGYFTLNSTVSDIDRNLDDFTEDIWTGWQDLEKDLAEFKAEVSASGQEVTTAKESALVSISNDVQSVSDSAAAAKQSALTSITQATSDVTDASAQFTADLADTQSTIDTQVDTLASNFTDNVATKQSDVTNKYNAFDTSVTQANQTIDEILALQGDVSDIKQKVSNQSKIYGVKFTGSNAAGIRTHDAVGMVANVGVDDQLAQNDFDNVSFYKRSRCLVYHDQNGNVRVMAYEGEPGFSLQGAIFAPYTEKAQVFYEQAPFYWNGDLDWPQVTATPLEGFELAPMFKNPTDKVYLPSYWLGLDNGKACSLSGVHPEYNSINGSMATARTYHSRAHLETMDARMSEYVLQLVEFATRDVQNVMTGAMSNRYNADDISILAEESTNRIVMANASADQYVAGQTICIGTTKNGSNIAARVVITSIDVYDASNKAITFDGPSLNIPVGAFTSSRAWRNGATDIVKASSGSPVSNSNGRYPCIWRSKVDPWTMAYSGISDVLIQRIGAGTPEDPYIYNAYKLKDPTLYNNGAIDGNWIKVDYNLSPSDGYVTQMGKDPKNPSVRMPVAVGGASTTYYAAHYYFGRYAVSAVFVGGFWADGRRCSPVCFALYHAPSSSSVNRLARLFVSPV